MTKRWRQRARRTAAAVLGLWLTGLAGERVLEWCWPYPLDALQALPCSRVLTAEDGTWLRVVPTPAGERVLPLRWAECPPLLKSALLVAEDERFFAHGGVDAGAVVRALVDNLRCGRVVSGASTLTLQVVRMVEPRPRTLGSKCLEVLRARQLERLLDKNAIASVYVEQVPMGGVLRGFAAAARAWFGRDLARLDAAQMAALVAMVPAPSARSPERRPALLRARRDALLARMVERGHLTAAAGAAAIAQDLGMRRHGWPWLAPHLCDGAVRRAEARGADLRVPFATGCDLGLQQCVQKTVAEAQVPGDGLAVVVVRIADGAELAVVGDREPRAPMDLSARPRSAGSTWKPFLYALARQQGAVAPSTLVADLPRAFDDWQPANFDRRWLGATRAGDALATSSNLAAVRCLEAVGTPAFARLLHGLGLRPLARPLHLDGALGTDAVTPRQLAHGYRRFAHAPHELGLDRATVEWTFAAMRRLPLVAGRSRAGDVAWKTGTSSGRRDAWCVGITGQHVVVVWLGNRDGRGLPDLVGVRSANRLLADVLALLPSG